MKINCQQFQSTISAQNDPEFDQVFPLSWLKEQGEHTQTCLDCVRWLEEQMDAEDAARGISLDPGVVTLSAVPGEAATQIEGEATDRLEKTNAHLRRTVTEVHKMIIWHQYAAAAIQGLCAQGLVSARSTLGDCTRMAGIACSTADAMMEAIRQRKMM